ncbi:MAG: hypothetical protein QOD46_545 [Actinomycetota bacterium]|jgi:hypothetical protein|nr:hypothetical protein [Actinomycetota bacterium]
MDHFPDENETPGDGKQVGISGRNDRPEPYVMERVKAHEQPGSSIRNVRA